MKLWLFPLDYKKQIKYGISYKYTSGRNSLLHRWDTSTRSRNEKFFSCIIVAVVVGILDITLGTFLKIITLGILSLSIFTWLLNAILIQVADWFLSGFKVRNFWWALLLAAIVSITSGLISNFITQ